VAKKAFPTLYAKASTGKVKIWEIWAEETAKGAEVVTRYGYVGSDKIQETRVKVKSGKNIGRSNETAPFEQACSEAESKWNKKQDKKYTQNPSGESSILLPMLAHDYKKQSHHIEWAALVQPKLNGCRCLATKVDSQTVRFTSRGGKEFTTLSHLAPPILQVLEVGETLDGELFTEELSFQEIVSAIRREKTENPNTQKIQYWVYDIVLDGTTFEERYSIYSEKIGSCKDCPHLWSVRARKASSEEEMLAIHRRHLEAGFEGTTIRNLKGLYRKDFRSPDLQKYKDFQEEEFEVIGGKEGVGLAEGTVTWTCVTEEGKEFDVRPRGTLEQRKYWWENLDEFIGKRLTVRYQNRSDTGVPIFPVGICIRQGTHNKDGSFKPDF